MGTNAVLISTSAVRTALGRVLSTDIELMSSLIRQHVFQEIILSVSWLSVDNQAPSVADTSSLKGQSVWKVPLNDVTGIEINGKFSRNMFAVFRVSDRSRVSAAAV